MSAGGGYTSRKFVTEELLTKLNTLLEQIARQQPPINPSVDAYKQEHDKVEYYLNELKKNPDDPYLRAQLHQAMDDRQHLYNLIQGNKTPFKTETSTTSEGTQTQTSTGVQTTIPQAQSTGTQSDVVSEMERIREMFRTPAAETDKPEKATFQDTKRKVSVDHIRPLPLIIPRHQDQKVPLKVSLDLNLHLDLHLHLVEKHHLTYQGGWLPV